MDGGLPAVVPASSNAKSSPNWPGASSWSPWIMVSPIASLYSWTRWITGRSSENWSM
ncbi:hypothetical protein SALCHL_006442 [Streptomyces albus subsp. chlorinus]|uniref:hypothetical protein n=1 Tax=Streptomyces albus TaxID=1888 RepID=UPI00191E33F7